MNINKMLQIAGINVELLQESHGNIITLHHLTSWRDIPKNIGDEFILIPGSQAAEGLGVYFSQGEPRVNAADGLIQKDGSRYIEAEIIINFDLDKMAHQEKNHHNWWRSKNSITKKFGRPRTYHTNNRKIKCKIIKKDKSTQGWDRLFCTWSLQ